MVLTPDGAEAMCIVKTRASIATVEQTWHGCIITMAAVAPESHIHACHALLGLQV